MDMFQSFVLLTCLVGYVTSQGCTHCLRKHPQQVVCDSDFVIHVSNISVESNVAIPGSSFVGFNLVTVNVENVFKSSFLENVTTVKFYSPSSICGTNFDLNSDYVISGSFEKTSQDEAYLLHGPCDYAKLWSKLSPKQQKGFKTKYRQMCKDECEIPGVKNPISKKVTDFEDGPGYEGATNYWTPDKCYYNPFKTEWYQEEDIEDCEETLGFCKKFENDRCSWQTTGSYLECFEKREQYVNAREASPAITSVEQCNVLRNRRQRKKCRKRVRERLAAAAEAAITLEPSGDE